MNEEYNCCRWNQRNWKKKKKNDRIFLVKKSDPIDLLKWKKERKIGEGRRRGRLTGNIEEEEVKGVKLNWEKWGIWSSLGVDMNEEPNH